VEGLLILVGIWVLDLIVKKIAANNKKKQQERQIDQEYREKHGDVPGYSDDDSDEQEFDSADYDEQGYNEPEVKPSRSLQDLIRQFENAQREAEQGNIEPPTPPVLQTRQHDGPYTLREIAEEVIELDVVDAEFLMDEFELSEGEAISMLAELQKHRIIGHDMGEGECDVLVHDLDELENLFSREKPVQNQFSEEDESETEDDSLQQELERQRKLNELEGRARTARESAAASSSDENPENVSDDGTAPERSRAPLVSARSIADVRKGFIWAKVLDEPRFKRRWSTQYR
jgi:hypothetical protein